MAAAAAAALIRSSAGRARALHSASAIVCKPVTGSHVVRVDGYSHLRQIIGKDQDVNSSAFDVGGHNWRVRLYPNGCNKSKHEGHIGVFLCLDSDPAASGHVWARGKFSVLDRLGNSCSTMDTGLCTFKHRGYWGGFFDFISNEELEKPEYLVDDTFALQCDVTVTSVRECSDHMAFISPNTKSEAP